MLRTLTYSSILFVLWALFARWYYTCYIKGNCCDETEIEARISGLRLSKKDAADILPQTDALGKMARYDQFFFNNNSEQPDLNPNNQEFLIKVADYLKSNAAEKLNLFCCYRPSESNDLAMKRAEYLKQYLVKLGVSADQIQSSTCKDNEKLLTPAYFEINASNISNEKSNNTASATESVLNFNIADENFASNSAKFEPAANFVKRANELKKYVASHPKVSMTITGHTDNVGNDDTNLRLGLLRAQAVKNYLAKMGINITIDANSKGELEPIADNVTEAGRAKNRRVTCRVNQ